MVQDLKCQGRCKQRLGYEFNGGSGCKQLPVLDGSRNVFIYNIWTPPNQAYRLHFGCFFPLSHLFPTWNGSFIASHCNLLQHRIPWSETSGRGCFRYENTSLAIRSGPIKLCQLMSTHFGFLVPTKEAHFSRLHEWDCITITAFKVHSALLSVLKCIKKQRCIGCQNLHKL